MTAAIITSHKCLLNDGCLPVNLLTMFAIFVGQGYSNLREVQVNVETLQPEFS